MEYYKLIDVLHTGTKGISGESRKFEPSYARRIDKVFKVYDAPIVGERAKLYYANCANDELYVLTSMVESVNKYEDLLRITTENSVFILQKYKSNLRVTYDTNKFGGNL